MASDEVGVFTLLAGVNSKDECDAPTTPEIALKEMEALEAIKEDICKWLSATMQVTLTPETFMNDLGSGVILCKLAALIQQAASVQAKEVTHTSVPTQPLSYNERADSGSFLARDNASNFIEFCRKLGVEEAVIFESEGLVLHRDEKRVILCLLDVARFAERVGISPPQLVRMEREIEELDSGSSSAATPESNHGNTKDLPKQYKDEKVRPVATKQSELAKKVLKVLTECHCCVNQLEVKDCGSGKFIICGGRIRNMKTLYARLLSDRIMVRIGGGWDTLDHFLLVHDPCRIKQFISLKEGPNDDEILQAHLQNIQH